MPEKRIKRGGGIITWETPAFDWAQEPSAEDDEHLNAYNFFVQRESERARGPWNPYTKAAARILEEHQLPGEAGLYRASRGEWERWPCYDAFVIACMRQREEPTDLTAERFDDQLQGTGYAPLPRLASNRFGEGSQVFEAAQIVSLAKSLELARSEGLAARVEEYAFTLGCFCMALRVRATAERDWTRGRAVVDGGRAAATAQHADKEPRRKRVLETLARKLKAGQKLTHARRETASFHRISVSTVRRYEVASKKRLLNTSH